MECEDKEQIFVLDKESMLKPKHIEGIFKWRSDTWLDKFFHFNLSNMSVY
jgi:hypothetical protein